MHDLVNLQAKENQNEHLAKQQAGLNPTGRNTSRRISQSLPQGSSQHQTQLTLTRTGALGLTVSCAFSQRRVRAAVDHHEAQKHACLSLSMHLWARCTPETLNRSYIHLPLVMMMVRSKRLLKSGTSTGLISIFNNTHRPGAIPSLALNGQQKAGGNPAHAIAICRDHKPVLMPAKSPRSCRRFEIDSADLSWPSVVSAADLHLFSTLASLGRITLEGSPASVI